MFKAPAEYLSNYKMPNVIGIKVFAVVAVLFLMEAILTLVLIGHDSRRHQALTETTAQIQKQARVVRLVSNRYSRFPERFVERHLELIESVKQLKTNPNWHTWLNPNSGLGDVVGINTNPLNQKFNTLIEHYPPEATINSPVIRAELNSPKGQSILIQYRHQLSGLVSQIGEARNIVIAESLTFSRNVILVSMGLLTLLVLVICWPTFSRLRKELMMAQSKEQKLLQQIQTDSSTGLSTRVQFNSDIKQALSIGLAARIGMIHIGVDNFKSVNERYGTEVGDRTIAVLADRLRSFTGNHTRVYHLQGDEFYVVHDGVTDRSMLTNLAISLQHLLQSKIVVDGNRFSLTVSMGMAFGKIIADCTQNKLMRAAEIAFKSAKLSGGGQYKFYDQISARNITEQLELEQSLRAALETGQIKPHYQPVMSLDTGVIHSWEALARWYHPEKGVLSAGKWSDLADDALLTSVSMSVIEQVEKDLPLLEKAGITQPIHVNITEQMLLHGTAYMVVESFQEKFGRPDVIGLEVTEGVMMMSNLEVIKAELKKIQALGASIYLDDFGTGFAALSHLNTLPADIIKLDKSFVQNLDMFTNTKIIKAMIKLSSELGKSVICEGVETDSVRSKLLEMGCGFGQGYLFNRALNVDEAIEFARATREKMQPKEKEPLPA